MFTSIRASKYCVIIAKLQQTAPVKLKIKAINPNALQILDYPPEDLLDQSLEIITAPGTNEHWQTAFEQLLNSENDVIFQTQLLSKTRQLFSTQISISFLKQPHQLETDRIVILFEDTASSTPASTPFLMHKAVEQSASAVIITDAKGCIEYINPRFCVMTGYSKNELIGKNPNLLQSGDTSIEQYQMMWQELLKKGEWRGEIKNKKKNGEDYWAYESISAIKNDAGDITHILAVEEEITDRKQFAAALQESEERFRQMADMTGEWLWEQNPEGYYIYCSKAVNAIIGFTPEQVIGKHYTEFLTPQDKTEFQPYLSEDNAFYALINHYRHKDGHQVIAESTGLPIKNPEGKVIKWRGADRDITARKHYEDALIESEKRTRLIIETALNAIVIIDSYGIIKDWNRRAEAMFGWSRDQAIGQQLAELIIPKPLRKMHHDGLQSYLKTGKSNILNKLTQQTALRKDGTEFPVEFSVAPLKIGHTFEFSGFIHDITGRKAAEERIRQGEVNLAIAQNEMNIAQRIQASLLPDQKITEPRFEVMGFCLPATQVGGDYFDYFFRDKQYLDMVIADVSGHSVGPALFMVAARSAIRAQAKLLVPPAQTLAVLNNFLYEDLNNSDYFITSFYLQYDTINHVLHYANAGHPPPLLYKRTKLECEQLDADGLIIGVRQDVKFEEKKVTLAQGDCLLLYTDGLTEAENQDGEFFGTERLNQIFTKFADQKPEMIIEQIINHLKAFCNTETFNDDVTLMVFKHT